MIELINKKLELLGESFEGVLKYQEIDRPEFYEWIKKYPTLFSFDWFQGVGLYGYYKLYKKTNDKKYLDIMLNYYQEQISLGLPPKTINTMAPMLTLCFLNQELKNPEYEKIILEWAEYLFKNLRRAPNGAFQHTTFESNNDDQLWDDTLFMSVLFLAKVGICYGKNEYVEDAIYQFLEHTKYLVDTSTGLWFHGANVKEGHNYGRALWGRGNSWVTIFIPDFLEILSDYSIMPSVERYMIEVLNRQVVSLAKFQNENGMWHTLIDDSSSYCEASATAGFGYGILKAVRKGYIDPVYKANGVKALEAVLRNINDNGILENVSSGTRLGLTKDFYKTIELKPESFGQAMAMLILIEGLNL